MKELEKRKLKYIGGLAKNRKVKLLNQLEDREDIRLDDLARSLPKEAVSEVILNLEKPKHLWVAVVEIDLCLHFYPLAQANWWVNKTLG